MNTTDLVGCSSAPTYEGTSALSFDSSKLYSIIKNRDSKFKLNLQGHTMMQILEVYEQFKRKISPTFRNSNTRFQLKRLEDSLGLTIMPIDICDDFYVEAYNYLLNVPGVNGKTLKPSTIKTYFTNIVASLTWASKHQVAIDPTYNIYKISSYKSPKIALTPSQISHIYHYDIHNTDNRKKLVETMKELKCYRYSFADIERARDLFVINCNIGQRFSDASVFDRSNFDETGTIFSCTQQKTGSRAKVDLTKYSIDKDITFEILRKYNYKAPAYGIDNANFNKILHALCKSIGGEFLKTISAENKITGQKVKESRPMWQLVSSHVSRRTFITYWCNNNLSVVKIQQCSGHKDTKMLSTYCIDND